MKAAITTNAARCFAGVTVLVATSLAMASTTLPSKQVRLAPPTIINTWNLNPQIQPSTTSVVRRAGENDKIPQKPGVRNTLPVGHLIKKTRGIPRMKFPGEGFTGFVPPDNDMGVGPTKIVTAVNSNFAIYKKDGTKLMEVGYETFFSSSVTAGTLVCDPCVFYDKTSDRYVVTALNVDFTKKVSQELIAVSATNDPQGKWFKYAIPDVLTVGNNPYWLDYPHFGFNKDSIVFAGNMFSFDQSLYQGAYLVVVPKAAVMSGGTPKVSYFSFPDLPTVQPVREYDATQGTAYAVAVDSNSTMTLLACTNPTADTPSVQRTSLTIPFQSPPQGDAVAPNNHSLDAFVADGRLYTAHLQNGHIVTAHNINNDFNRVAVRWYDVTPNNYPNGVPSLAQAGTIDDGPNSDCFQPAVHINQRGTIGILYNQSSEFFPPQLMFASHLAGDPTGTVKPYPVPLALSSASTYGDPGVNRWGDYSAVDEDPADGTTFWTNGMVGSNFYWKSDVSSVFVDTLQENSPVASVNKLEGSSSTGTAANTVASDNLFYNISSAYLPGTGHVASAVINFTLPDPAFGTVVGAHLDYQGQSPIGVSTLVYAWNWTTSRWDYLSAFPSTNTNNLSSVQLTEAQFKQYRSATNQVRLVVRGVSPQRLQSAPTPFTTRIDYLNFVREER